MKKLSLMAVVASFALLMSSCCCNSEKKECCKKEEKKECCKKTCCEGMNEEQKQACAEFQAQWADFDNSTEDVQKELIAKKKAFFDSKREALKAKIAECEKYFEGFDALTIAEQKAALDNAPCCKDKKDCCKKKCDKDKKEGCKKQQAEEETAK